MAPPRGYQEPPIGPVIIFRSNFWAKVWSSENQNRELASKTVIKQITRFMEPSLFLLEIDRRSRRKIAKY